MKKIVPFSFILTFLLFGCVNNAQNSSTSAEEKITLEEIAEVISEDALSNLLHEIASDKYEGRMTGEEGQKLAAEYIVDFYKKNEIPAGNNGEYFQPIPSSYFNNKYGDSENILAFIEGTEKPEEVIVISAHYDHVGMDDEGNIINGADDDGSGTVAVMQMAKAFKKAKDEGMGPKRSVLFLLVTAEEIGLLGSKFYSKNPVYPLEKTVTNLNIDMIGRVDKTYENQEDQDYLYLIGADRISQELHDICVEQNDKYIDLHLDFKYNEEDDPMNLYYRSDHYNFAKHGIPSIFFFSGLHDDYHQPTDTADKIEYDLLTKRAQLVFYIAWEVANKENCLSIDEDEESENEE